MSNVLKKDIAGDYALRLSWRYQDIDFLGLPNLKDNPTVRLDDIYVPLRVTWDNRRDPKQKPLYIPEALEQRAAENIRHLVVLGDPGSGKSTLVKVIVSAFGRSANSSFKRMFGELLPVPIILRDYKDKVRKWKKPEDMLHDFIATLDAEIRGDISTEWLFEQLRDGQGFLLLDGLDEIGNVEDRKHLRDKVVKPLLKEITRSYAILTSRIVGYDEVPFEHRGIKKIPLVDDEGEPLWEPFGIVRCYVAPFADEDIEQFIVRWYKAREPLPERQQAGIESFKRALSQNDRVRRLAENPLLLTLMALVHRVTANLPSGRVKLYDKIVEAFLETIQIYRQFGTPATLDEMKRWLAKVGWQMQNRRYESLNKDEDLWVHRDVVLRWLTEAIEEERGTSRAKEDAEKFLDYVARRSGLLIPRGPEHFAFVHLTFQEYFAAFELRGMVRRFDELAEICAKLASQRIWHETLNLLFEMLTEFSGACNDLFDEIKNKTASNVKTKETAVELFSTLLLDEDNGLSRAKQQEACEVVLAFVCQNYSEAVIKNLRNFSEPASRQVNDWFKRRLETVTPSRLLGHSFFLIGGELFENWHETLWTWVNTREEIELDDLQFAQIMLIEARDLETYRQVCLWGIEKLPLDVWLRNIITYDLNLADIYRFEIYSNHTDSPRHRLLVEASCLNAICKPQIFKFIVYMLGLARTHALTRSSARECQRALTRTLALAHRRALASVLASERTLALTSERTRALARVLASERARVLASVLVRARSRDLSRNLVSSARSRALLRARARARALAGDLASTLVRTQRPNVQIKAAHKVFVVAEWIFFAPEVFDEEGDEVINQLQKLTQANDDWTRLQALSALLLLGEGSLTMCNERNLLLEKGIKHSQSFTFPIEFRSETESKEFINRLPRLLEIVCLHDPDDIWLRPELFDASRPESKYFLSKPREFFVLAAEALDPEHETELWKWREAQEEKIRSTQ
ncbi:MAG: NACHT domain-containing protein [Acidobacteriota bacterium]